MANTRDVTTKPKLTWLDAQKPNTLMLFESFRFDPLVLPQAYLTRRLEHRDRRGGIATYLEAVNYRLCAWPNPGEPQGLFEKRNVDSMEMLALALRIYSR